MQFCKRYGGAYKVFFALGKLFVKILQKFFIGLFALLLSLDAAMDSGGICYPTEMQVARCIHEQTGLTLPQGELLESIEPHSGFHGDGEYFAAYRVADDAFTETLLQASGWQSLPLPQDLEILVYGSCESNSAIAPHLKTASIPKITEGYWYFSDRYDQRSSEKSRPILTRSSYNFSIAIYDMETAILYFAALDT